MSAAERHAELIAALFEEAAEGGEADADVDVDCCAPPPPDENWTASTAVTALTIRLTANMIPINLRMFDPFRSFLPHPTSIVLAGSLQEGSPLFRSVEAGVVVFERFLAVP
jgi:hypothetical protein